MYKVPFIIFLACTLSSCVIDSNDVVTESETSVEHLLISKPALVCYGLIVGVLIGMVLARRRRAMSTSIKKKPAVSLQRKFMENHEVDEELERKYYSLEIELKKNQDKNRELERDLAESRLLSNDDRVQETVNVRQEPESCNDVNLNIDSEATRTILLYFLQPSREGWFKEAGRIDNAAEALYELSYQSKNPEEASLKFIDTPSNVFLAVQNEPTWILVACERSNVPFENTSSIRTDIPGKAVLKNGEWEIVQKAMITYIS